MALTRRVAMAGLALTPAMARARETLAWDFSFPGLDGGTLDFGKLRGRVLLVVNTASFCGFAPQFRTLEALNKTRATDGLTVIGMPSDDYWQEADNNAKVKQVCELTYGVDFPMTAITRVTGSKANPFYAWVRQQRDWEPNWNFNKVVIGRDGRIHALFRSFAEPQGKLITAAIDQALAGSA